MQFLFFCLKIIRYINKMNKFDKMIGKAITKKVNKQVIKKNKMAELIKLLKNIEKSATSGNFEMNYENLKKFHDSLNFRSRKGIFNLPRKNITKEQYLILSIVNYIISQDNSEAIIILQAKEIVSRLEKNNNITSEELLDNIINCKILILDFFNKISKISIEIVRNEINNFVNNTDCKFDEDIIKIFEYISNQNNEDLHIIIQSFILRSKGYQRLYSVITPSLKQYYKKYLSDSDEFEKEKITTQIHLTPISNKEERKRLLNELEKFKKNDDTLLCRKIIISKMLKKYEFTEDDEVEVLLKEGSVWLPAKITSVNSDDTFDILYADGDNEEQVKRENIRPQEDIVKNDLYYMQNLNSISQEYKNIIKYNYERDKKNIDDKISQTIKTINDLVDSYNYTKETIAKVGRGEKIRRYYPTSPNERYDDNVDEEKENIKHYASEIKKNKSELEKLKQTLAIMKNRQKIINSKKIVIEKDILRVNEIKQKAEIKLKFLNDNIEKQKDMLSTWGNDKKKEEEDMRNRDIERKPPRTIEQRRWTTMDIETIDAKIKDLNDNINSDTNKIEFITRILKRNQSNRIDYDIVIDAEEIQNEIALKFNKKKIPTNFINDLYDEIQDSHAKNDDDNNKFLEIIYTEDDSDFEESSDMYNKYRNDEDESNSESVKKKNIYAGIDTVINEFTDSEKIKQEENEKKTEEIEADIKEIVNKNRRELDEICKKYKINIAPMNDITTYKEIIINKLRTQQKYLFNLLKGEDEERIKNKNIENKIKLYDADDENFINFLTNIKDNIDNESELKDAINVFFENIEDTKVEEIMNLMTNNYDINTFKEFLRYFFEQRKDKDSYNFIQYYNKFGYIIENENKKDENEENEENEENDENDDDENEKFNKDVRKQNCDKYKQILKKYNIVDETTLNTWKQNNENKKRKKDDKKFYTYDNDTEYEMVLLAYKNVIEEKLCENIDDEVGLDESELLAIYKKKMEIAKKLNIKFNPKLDKKNKNNIYYLIEILNTLINNNKNNNENYKAFDEHLSIRKFWLGLNLNDENEVIRKMKEIIKTKLLTNFYKNEEVYNSHKYSDIFKQMLNNLSITSIIEMVNEYLQQYRLTFEEYYAQFCIEKEKINNKLNNIQRFICDHKKPFEPETDCKEEFSSYEQLAEHIKKIHYDTLGEQPYDQAYFMNRPWINNIIKKTFICKVDDDSSILDFDLFIKTSDSIPNKFTDVYGNVWFQVNKHFFNIETNKYISKQQNDEVLSFFDNRYKCLLKIKLGFKIVSDDPMKDFIIQNEDIFKNEQDFFNTIYDKLNEITVNKLLDDNLNNNSLDLGRKYIEKRFGNFGITYTYDEIFKNIDIENLTIREYANYICSICSYLENELFDNIFRKRLVKRYYNPEEILNLNMADKIPETQCNGNNFSASVVKYMNDKLNKDIHKFGETLFTTSRNSNIQLYQLSNETKLQGRFGEKKHFFQINNIPEIYDSINYICKKEIGNIKVEDIILYSEKTDDEIKQYCLNIKDVLKRIYNNDDIDYFPEIPTWFYNDIKRKYNKNLIDEEVENIVKDEENKEKDDYEYKFVNIIISDIIEKTNNTYNLSQLYVLFGVIGDDTEEDIEQEIEEEDEEEEEEKKGGTRLLKDLKKSQGRYIFERSEDKEDDGRYIEEDNEEDNDRNNIDIEEDYNDDNNDRNNIEEDYNVDDDILDKKKCEICDMDKGNEIVKTIKMENIKKKEFEVITICTGCLLEMEF